MTIRGTGSDAENLKPQNLLAALETAGALWNGHFILRSGLHSDRFFQCAMALRYPALAEELCQGLAAKLRSLPGLPTVQGVIAPALGGLVVGHELARALGVMSIFAEKDGAKLAMRRFQIEAEKTYIVAEDVITRGGRVQETIDLVRAGGGVVAAVGVLVDRSGGAARFDVPVVHLLEMNPVVWTPEECPLGAAGIPAIHPGT